MGHKFEYITTLRDAAKSQGLASAQHYVRHLVAPPGGPGYMETLEYSGVCYNSRIQIRGVSTTSWTTVMSLNDNRTFVRNFIINTTSYEVPFNLRVIASGSTALTTTSAPPSIRVKGEYS